MKIDDQNLFHAQNWQKKAHNKRVNRRSYAPGNKIWLNRKYIQIK